MNKLELVSFEYSDYYRTGSLTVKRDGREFVIKPFDGVHPEYKYADDDDHILSKAESEFNRHLHSITFWCEEESWTWSDSKQMYWQGECEVDDEGEPIEDEDGCWCSSEDRNDSIHEMIDCNINDCDELHNAINAMIDAVIEKEQDEAEFESKFSNTPIIQSPGVITRIYDRCEMTDGEDDYCIIIGERSGQCIERVLMIHDRIALVKCDDFYFNVYVSGDEAEPNSYGVRDWKVALEEFNELVAEEEVA